ncbi:TonB-dependent receptor family protein [Bartonella sp. HY406]|uniref:TonB-dependent receptor family protein n=1 Tax=Bartonella sp. HY406 TaxID=2979331 RepID=UPI0021C93EDC|nr:TonB-dependent receptor [Bartonella sp. HY406]UXN03603.1 TonB-dependent receptor [Bartonella sp. HY406]
MPHFIKQGSKTHLGHKSLFATSLVALLLSTGLATAQTASPGAPIVLDAVVIDGNNGREAEVERRFQAMPGGVNLVSQDDMPTSANLTLSRALEQVPGVVIQNFFGGNDQPRIQIRGSGLQQNPVERGILMLQNGLPLNRADGSYIVGLANPSQAQSIEAYRGYMANRIGATVLGGAINMVSPTGLSQQGASFTASGGSFGQYNLGGQFGFAKDNYDGFIQVDHSKRDGFRDYNASERTSISGNIGFRINDRVTTRFFAGYTDLDFDVAGPVNKTMLKKRPQTNWSGPTLTPNGAINPGPNVWRDRPKREATQYLIGNRTSFEMGAHLFDVAFSYSYSDDMFRFPVSAGVRQSKGGDFTALAHYAYSPDESKALPLFELSLLYATGSMERDYYLNQSGSKGAKFGANDLDSTTLSLFAGLNVPIAQKWTLSPSVSFAHATRDNDDRYDGVRRPTIAYNPRMPDRLLPNGAVAANDTSYKHSYSGWSPALALSYEISDEQTAYVAVSHNFEPPSQDDLIATINGTPNSSAGRPNPATPFVSYASFATPDLDAQKATTVEAGWRGRFDRFSFDLSSYYSWVDNELLSLRDVSGAPLGAVNADDTRHFGIDIGLGAQFTNQFSGRLAYTYQNFRFHDDALRGNNYLAGAPRHIINAMLQYQPIDEWIIQTNVRWLPSKTPVDNMNTLYNDAYAIVDLRSEYQINKNFRIFGEITNLFDKKYASSTIIADSARPDQAAFLPGDGRGFFAGIKASF